MIFLRLFFEFFKTGLFAFGGAIATIPFLSEMGQRTGWFTQEFLADMLAVSESTPGPIGVNTATYVGYTVAGIPGGIVATLGLVTPSIIVILIVSAFLKAFRSNKYVKQVLFGIRPASVGLIAAAGLTVLKLCLVDTAAYAAGGAWTEMLNRKGAVLFALLWVLTNRVRATKDLHPIVFVGFGALVGILFRFAGA